MKVNYYAITMKAKNGRTLYLDLMTGSPKWTVQKANACWWNDEKSATDFAKKWFKNFKGWNVVEQEQDLREIV